MGRMGSYLPAMAMVGMQFTYAGVALFTRAALLQGLSPMIFVVYRQAIATLCLSPISFFSRRRSSSNCSVGKMGFCWIFLASLIGVTGNQNAYFEGLYLSSSSMASAMTNLMPGITFVIAAMLGLEKINLRNMRGIAKILGTIVCVGGAICMALLKGHKLLNTEQHFTNLSSINDDKWLFGCLYLFGSSIMWSLWLVLQVPIAANCPDHLYTSAWMCFLATTESATVAAIFGQKELRAWKLDSALKIFCCLYSGMALAISFFVQAWCVPLKGPLFSATFNPLCIVIATFFGALILHEEIYMGSMLGAFGVIIGLYIVLWGKADELQDVEEALEPNLRDDQTRTSGYVRVSVDCKILDRENRGTNLLDPLIADKRVGDKCILSLQESNLSQL